jgi:hypothetical protein
LNHFRVLAASLLAASLYACGGGGGGTGGGPPSSGTTPPPQTTPTPTAAPTPTPSPTPTRSPKPTPTPGLVTLTPNSITFTTSGPGDYTIVVSGGSGSYAVGTDTCTPQGIAEWQQDPSPSQNDWDVSYGVNLGMCTIQFVDKANNGNFAYLQVDNQHNPH